MYVVPKGIEHKPYAEGDADVSFDTINLWCLDRVRSCVYAIRLVRG